MSKEDYRDKIEEHRQSFEVEKEQEQPLSRVSRMNRNGSDNKGPKKTKQDKNPLMKILLVIFILIPFTTLVLVWYFYEPGKTLKETEDEVDSNNPVVEVEDQNNSDKNSIKIDKNEAAEAEKKAQEQARKDAEKLEAEQKAADEEKAAEDAKIAQEKAAEEAAKKAEEAKKQEAASAKTHTVQSNETLYRIAVKYYGNGSESTLAKIRAANGMPSDVIQVGQKIKLP
ncbi:MAG: LysM peptidoglycan-binding domain-containing protein [Lysinibacillus sp.]